MREERGHWFLLTGLLMGIAAGLVYAWLIAPVRYIDTAPSALRADFKDRYRALIAAAYVASGNLPRAQARLVLLGDADIPGVLAEQAQKTLADGRFPDEARALGLLAVALGQGPVSAALPSATSLPSPASVTALPVEQVLDSTETPPPSATPTPVEPQPAMTLSQTVQSIGLGTASQTAEVETPTQVKATGTATPTATRTLPATGTPLPTRTPTATPGAPFVLQQQIFLCDVNLSVPLIQVLAEDDGQPVPGVEAVVSWEGGEDHFFTGLKPELGLGYADFLMAPGVVYNLRLAGGGPLVTNLTPAECERESGGRFWGSWLLIFRRP